MCRTWRNPSDTLHRFGLSRHLRTVQTILRKTKPTLFRRSSDQRSRRHRNRRFATVSTQQRRCKRSFGDSSHRRGRFIPERLDQERGSDQEEVVLEEKERNSEESFGRRFEVQRRRIECRKAETFLQEKETTSFHWGTYNNFQND